MFVAATFVDCGAGQFFLDELNKTEIGKTNPTKRLKYTALEFQDELKNKLSGGALGPDWHSSMKHKSGLSNTKSVNVEIESEVHSIEEVGNEVLVTLTSGKVIKCDLVVSATGVVPNGHLIKINELKVDEQKGIIVNEQMETNLRHIYAAGDVCSCQNWKHSPHWFQMRLWTQARQMGAYAGQCMVHAWEDKGAKKDLDFCFEMFTHATKFFGYKGMISNHSCSGVREKQDLIALFWEVISEVEIFFCTVCDTKFETNPKICFY